MKRLILLLIALTLGMACGKPDAPPPPAATPAARVADHATTASVAADRVPSVQADNGTLLGGAQAGGIIGNPAGQTNQRMDRPNQAIGQARMDANVQIINVPTSTGGVIPVRLLRQDAGWIGPRGESYTTLPTADQLRPAYGF